MKPASAWLLAVVCSLPNVTHAKDNSMTADQAQALNTIEAMTDAFHAGDIDRVMQAYEPLAAVAFEPGKPVTDPAQLVQGFGAFSALNPQFTYSGHEVIVAGDIAMHIAPWTMVGKMPDGQEITQSGLSVAVLRQQPDGRWLMVIDNPHGSHLTNQAQ